MQAALYDNTERKKFLFSADGLVCHSPHTFMRVGSLVLGNVLAVAVNRRTEKYSFYRAMALNSFGL